MPTHLSRNLKSMLPTLTRSATKTMLKSKDDSLTVHYVDKKHKKKIQVMSK